MKSIAEIFRSYAQFDAEGRHVNGTDKQSNHNYGDAYERLFKVDAPVGYIPSPNNADDLVDEYIWATSRTQVKLMMEVGVADGSCLLAWREVFPNAQIVGMDIHHSDKAHGERIEFRIGDQRVKRDCENAAAERQFDLIVEDATHEIDATLLTLYWLWPFVKPGGLYVVEEWPDISNNIRALWPNAEIVMTDGPFGGVEPLVVFRKPL